jgi:Bardet-Biedl syndrome 9 protein
VASYQTASNEPRVAQHTITVPLLLACRPRPALKAAAHKITLDTLHPALPLSELFADFLSSAEEHMDLGDIGIGGTGGGASSLGFQLWTNSVQNTGAGTGTGTGTGTGAAPHLQPAVVSILVSKNTGRYRVQSDSLPALFLILSELERRLSKHIATAEDISAAYSSSSPSATSSSALSPSKRAVTCDDEYPLDEYFASIRLHFQLRGTLAEQLSMLNNSAHQFRMVQRRLLVRFKDRNPTPLLGLDTLMRESYSALLRISKPSLLYCSVLHCTALYSDSTLPCSALTSFHCMRR